MPVATFAGTLTLGHPGTGQDLRQYPYKHTQMTPQRPLPPGETVSKPPTQSSQAYAAPHNVSEDEFNRRIPLSIARWHPFQHLFATAGQKVELEGLGALLGLPGLIVTDDVCKAAGGTFRPQIVGWVAFPMPNFWILLCPGRSIPTVWPRRTEALSRM
jgi:hypothetical protein